MQELYELKEVLLGELEEYGSKEMTAGSLDVVDKLTHTIKNLDKIIEKCEDDEYSNEGRGSYARGGSRRSYGRRSYADGMSSARRRDSRGRYSRDYSGDEALIFELQELMQDAPDERTKKEFQKFIKKIEQM